MMRQTKETEQYRIKLTFAGISAQTLFKRAEKYLSTRRKAFITEESFLQWADNYVKGLFENMSKEFTVVRKRDNKQ